MVWICDAYPIVSSAPLKAAPVVLLFLSPGLDKHDLKDARTRQGRARYAKTRKGYLPFRSRGEHPTGQRWLISKTKAFGVEFEKLRRKIAVLNIGAYHSNEFKDYPLLAALPSSRVSLDWAQKTLFPQAIRGERVVICLRAAHFWGLAEGTRKGLLFVPSVTRGGHMRKKTRKQKKMRNDIARAVQKAIVRKK